MNFKGLLLGSAAAVVAVSGARAADAIIIPEPEPLEYVRICDVYGEGYFYIPGTENCLKISGYYRYEMQHDGDNSVTYGGVDLAKLARFAPNFTVKSETEAGTLTGFAELEFDWVNDGTQGTNLNHMYIEIGGILIGKTDNPYSRFLGYGGPTLWEGIYGFNNTSEVSYTYTGDNGFSFIIAVTEDPDFNWAPNVEGGVKFEQAWGSIGAIAGYDESGDSWGAKIVGRANFTEQFSASLHVFYGSDSGAPGVYHIFDPAGVATEWSVMLDANAVFTDKVSLGATAQWFDTDEFEFSVNLPLTPVANLTITPEVVYATTSPGGGDQWHGRIRFQRDF